MKNLNIKNIPESLHSELKKRAAKNRRSVNREVVHVLEQALMNKSDTHPDAERILKRVRALRRKFKGSLNLEEIKSAINEGRP